MAKKVTADDPKPAAKPVDEPPSFDRVMASLRMAGRLYVGLGILIVACGVVVLAVGLFGEIGETSDEILKYGGVLVSSLSLVPFRQGWSRLERIGFLATLRDRWAQLAQTGDPNNQIVALNDIYMTLLRESLRVPEQAEAAS
jgi:hypothetical protein